MTMGQTEPTPGMDFTQASTLLTQIKARLNDRLLGQESIVDEVLIALISGGHILIEGVPGLGKTLLVQLLSGCIRGQYKRIQFTPDLMPADITGHAIYDMNDNRFRLRTGPVFTNLLLADEINRAPAKTQAALLEAMQERQVTIEGTTHRMPTPFMVLATQNPIEQEGTYPLPEAELDRFLLKSLISYPEHSHEVAMAKRVTTHVDGQSSTADDEGIVTPEDMLAIQKVAADIAIDDAVVEYAVNLVRETRQSVMLSRGAGPRGSIALLRAARAHALLRGAAFVLPDDVKRMAPSVLRHRIHVSADMEIEGINADIVLARIMDSVDAPRT